MRAAVIIGTYVVCGFLTFGHIRNSYEACGEEPSTVGITPEWNKWVRCRFDASRDLAPAAGGVVWPAYWLGRAAIEITK